MKYDRLTGALASIVAEGGSDETQGDCQENGTIYDLIVGKRPSKPSYILSEDSYGFVDAETFATEAEARKRWDEITDEIDAENEEAEALNDMVG